MQRPMTKEMYIRGNVWEERCYTVCGGGAMLWGRNADENGSQRENGTDEEEMKGGVASEYDGWFLN